MLRFGLIGCGQHARWAVLPAIEGAAGCELAAVAEIVPANLDAVTDEAVAKHDDYRRMLAEEELDAVYVSTTVEAHCEPTVAALAAGCHVVCEKPMAVGEAQCRRMVDAAEQAGKILAIDFETRYAPPVQQVRRWIEAGHIGTVRAIHFESMWDAHKAFGGDLAERRKRLMMGSGCLDCGIHKLDLARFYCGGGEWRDVRAVGAWFGEDVPYPPHIAVTARLSGGVLVTLNESFAYTAYIKAKHFHTSEAIVGEKGAIALDVDEQGRKAFRLVSDTLQAECPLAAEGHGSAISRLLEDMDAAATDGKPLPPWTATGVDGMMAQIAVDAANRSAVENGDSCATE